MSGAPTSGVEAHELEALVRAGWTEADLAWERQQAGAAEHDASGRHDEAAALWAEALRLGRERVQPGTAGVPDQERRLEQPARGLVAAGAA